MPSQRPNLLRGPILNPQPSGGIVEFRPDGIIASDRDTSTILWIGDAAALPAEFNGAPERRSCDVILPPFLDLHTHLPQHPIRGRFTEGVEGNPEEGRLIAGLRRNVFPEEARFSSLEHAARVIAGFQSDTLSHGVVGGSAFGTVHAAATDAALSTLGSLWSVGMVLMNVNCPDNLRTDEPNVVRDMEALTSKFGRRFIVTDRFAVSVTTPLRRLASDFAHANGLRMQTHLNEQRAEKALIERAMYPEYASYTDVYKADGLLDNEAILAHCIQMTPPEWCLVADAGATVAHCPTSNTLLGSGTMPLDDLPRSVEYAICTDVGASPTCSLLAEMAQYLKVHQGISSRVTPSEALFRVTLAPARILGLDSEVGSFAPGKPLSYIEVRAPDDRSLPNTADAAILALLGMTDSAPVDDLRHSALRHLASEGLPYGPQLDMLTDDVHQTAKRFETAVRRVVLRGETVYERFPKSEGCDRSG